MSVEGTFQQVLAGEARWTVVCADCLDVLPTLPDKSVDAVVTDPPYGIDFRGSEWDAVIPDWIEAARRVSATVLAVTGTLTLWDYPRPEWVLCWNRPASNSRSRCGGFSHWSPVLVYGKTKFPTDSISLHAIQHASPPCIEHQTPKPAALLEWIVSNCTDPDDLILDPFAGSGTTGVAALRLGRRVILIEREQKWADLCRERLRAEESGSTLKAARAGQLPMFGKAAGS